MAEPAHRTIIYSMYVLHIPDPDVGMVVMCSNPCLMLGSGKNMLMLLQQIQNQVTYVT